MKRREVIELRSLIEKSVQHLDNNDALKAHTLFPKWLVGVEYVVGYKVQQNGVLYNCITAHTSQETWSPDVSPSLWAKVLVAEDGTPLPWEQPDNTNAYKKGDKVTYDGSVWVSDIDNNVWQPGVYGWTKVEEI